MIDLESKRFNETSRQNGGKKMRTATELLVDSVGDAGDPTPHPNELAKPLLDQRTSPT